MSEARQRDFLHLGAEGCYFFCLVKIAEEELGGYVDAYRAYLNAVEKALLRTDCFVDNAVGVLALLTNRLWSYRKRDALYVPEKDEFEVLRYERKETTRTFTHFVLGDGNGGVLWDPMGTSETVARGVLQSKRIFRKLP